jgi:hypothetical protein
MRGDPSISRAVEAVKETNNVPRATMFSAWYLMIRTIPYKIAAGQILRLGTQHNTTPDQIPA